VILPFLDLAISGHVLRFLSLSAVYNLFFNLSCFFSRRGNVGW